MSKTCRTILQLGILLNGLWLVSGDLVSVLAQLGWKRTLMVSRHREENKKEEVTMAKNGILVASTQNPCVPGFKFNPYLDGMVIDMRSFNETKFQQGIQCGRPEPFRSLLIVTKHTLEDVRSSLATRNETKGFLGLVMPEEKLLRMVRMAFNKETVVMQYMPTEYNFQNLQLECYNLRYPPVIYYDCVKKDCIVSGMYPNIISHLARKYNFSVAYHLDPSGKWGSSSKLGHNATSVLKTLHGGHSAFSFSWIGTYDRLTKFDHVVGITLKLEMYMMQSGPKVSMDMVFQPFSALTWAFITSFVSLVYLANKVLSKSRSRGATRFKYALALLLGLFMTLTISFYRSAMILALTAKQPPPFETLLDGLADPDWDLVYTKGSEGLYKSYYKLIPDGQRLEDKVLHDSYKYRSESREEKYQSLTNPRTFFLEDGVRAANFLRNTKCHRCKDAFRFGRPETKNSGFLFEKHSPLQEVFKHGLVHMRETGAIDHIKHSLGPDYIPTPYQSALSLTIQLLVLLFMFLGWVVIIMCPAILMVEYLWKWLHPRLRLNIGNAQQYKCERTYEEGTCQHCGLKQIRQTICVEFS